MKTKYLRNLGLAVTTAGFMSLSVLASGAQAADKISMALPGVPPVFSTLMTFTAKGAGFYKKYNLDVKLRPFNSGVGAARAVASGKVDVSLSPTPPVAVMISNGGVDLVGIQGMERPDWVLGSMDPTKTKCEDVRGKAVGVDSPRGARWIQRANMIRACKMRPDKDVPTVNLSSNVSAAMVAGQLTFGVLHLDDISVIERESGKKVTIVSSIAKAAPGTHYLTVTTTKKTLAAKRDAMVRLVAAHIEAIAYIYNPANLEKVAVFAKATGRNKKDAMNAIKRYTAINYWPKDSAGLSAKRLGKSIKIQVMVGKRTKGKSGINPKKKAVTPAEYSDLSVYKDALALVKKSK